jgi:hypothetical protein
VEGDVTAVFMTHNPCDYTVCNNYRGLPFIKRVTQTLSFENVKLRAYIMEKNNVN